MAVVHHKLPDLDPSDKRTRLELPNDTDENDTTYSLGGLTLTGNDFCFRWFVITPDLDYTFVGTYAGFADDIEIDDTYLLRRGKG